MSRPVQHSKTAAYAASLVVSLPSGKKDIGCLRVKGHNSSASAQFIQIHDAAALPADAAVPVHFIKVDAAKDFDINFSDLPNGVGMPMKTGIVVCNSSTGPTKAIGAADCWFNVFWS